MRIHFLAALVAAFFMSACGGQPIIITWPGNPTPTPEPTATPGEPEPTATPRPEPTPPVEFIQFTEGAGKLRFRGLDRAPLSCEHDIQALATFTWEQGADDRTAPVLELQLMGNTPEPCLERPCGRSECKPDPGKMGLRIRYTANILHDGQEPNEHLHCGSGLNANHRLALGPLGPGGSLDVTVALDEEPERGGQRLIVSTPVDAWSIPVKHPGTMGFGKVALGSPWKRPPKGPPIRGWSWHELSAHRWASMEVLEWNALDTSPPTPCR